MTSLLLAAGPHTQPLIGHTRAVLGPAVGKTDGQNNKRGETLISVSSITLIGEYAKFQILPKREKENNLTKTEIRGNGDEIKTY